jgi:nitric oxide reductase NorE protein
MSSTESLTTPPSPSQAKAATNSKPHHNGSATPAERHPRKWIPGEAGIWAFILVDFSVFGGYFGVFLTLRARQPADWLAGSQALSPTHGAVNTAFMLTASLFVALAIQHIRQGHVETTRKLLVGAGICGAAFIVNKPIEWISQLQAGNGAHRSEFFQLYFLLTGIHLLHVIAAMFVVLYLWKKAAKVRTAPTVLQARAFENGASYWHLVDLIWMVLFALFYLVR